MHGWPILDQNIVVILNHWAWSHPWATYLAVLVAQKGMLVLPVTVGVVALRSSRSGSLVRLAALAGILAVALAAVLIPIVGALVDRPRPFVALPIMPLFPHVPDSSFPSDHTLVGVAFVAPFLWRLPRLGGWLALWALAVGFARVVAGVHYPSDVLASAILAILPSVVGLMAVSFLIRRLPPTVAGRLGLFRPKQLSGQARHP